MWVSCARAWWRWRTGGGRNDPAEWWEVKCEWRGGGWLWLQSKLVVAQ